MGTRSYRWAGRSLLIKPLRGVATWLILRNSEVRREEKQDRKRPSRDSHARPS